MTMIPPPKPFRFGDSSTASFEDTREGDELFTNNSYELDRIYWLRLAWWSLEEAVAISLGRDPRYVNWLTVEKYTNASEHAYQYALRRETIFRAKDAGHLLDPTLAGHFLTWVLRVNLPCSVDHYELPPHTPLYMPSLEPGVQPDPMQTDPNLMSLLSETQARNEELKATNQQLERELTAAQERREVSAPARSALMKLVYAMAKEKYGYNPNASRSSTTSKIRDDLNFVGLDMDPKRIREYLEMAAKEVQKPKSQKRKK